MPLLYKQQINFLFLSLITVATTLKMLALQGRIGKQQFAFGEQNL